jgi:valyl-tRNA synthetase
VYTTWLENLRDWTISRQLWWGHQIPAWYDADGNVYVARTKEKAYEQAGTQDLTQDSDVLDTWFSSALWPFSTLGWTGEEGEKGRQGEGETDLDSFYPTDVLVTGRDIIFLWVSRMVMTGLKFMGERPFDDVIIHGTVLDKNGQRMSKTKNNGIDPLHVFEKYGVDATRMTLAGSATGVDFAWRDERVESFRNFANKIWNATRFCLMNANGVGTQSSPPSEGGVATDLADGVVPEIQNPKSKIQNRNGSPPSEGGVAAASADGVVGAGDLDLPDRWIVSRLNKTAKAVNRALETYQFHEAVQLLYHFFWDDFCDWYIELKKDEITGGDTEATTRIVALLEQALRLLHPFMPFLTEELWQKLPGISSSMHNSAYSSAEQTIMLTTFPTGDDSMIDESAETEMQSVIELITKVRNIRAEMNIKPSDRLSIHVAADQTMRGVLSANEAQIKKLARADNIVLSDTLEVPRASARAVLTGASEIAVPLEGLINFEKERARLKGQIEKLSIELQRLEAQLSNKSFVEKAPEEKVAGLRTRAVEISGQTRTLEQNLQSLG